MDYLPYLIVGGAVLAIWLAYEWEACQPGYFMRLILRKGQPSYDGRAFSDWLKDLAFIEKTNLEATGEERFKPTQKYSRAAEAMRKMGADALPPLLAIIRASRPGLELESERRLREDQFQVEMYFNNDAAIEAFEALGDLAAPAIPELEQLLYRQESANIAAEALASIGPAAKPVLIRALQHREGFVRIAVAGEFLKIGREGMLEEHRRCLRDSEFEVRANAAFVLACTEEPPESFLPPLIESLQSGRDNPHDLMIAITLGQLGAVARPAVPALLAARDRSDFKGYFAEAIALIDPEAAKAAGIEPK